MDLIKRETLFEENELVQFISNAFKDEMVPKDKETFFKCFNHQTTDGSLCFSYKFGKDKDDWAMMFFYPTHCAVPIPYKKHLRNQEYCNISLLILDYQQLLASKIDDINYLIYISEVAKQRFELNFSMMKNLIATNFTEEEECIDRALVIKGRRQSISKYKERYEEVEKIVSEKIDEIKNKFGV